MKKYKAGTTYAPGEVVLSENKLYQKLDDGDNSAPDDVAGGWVEIPTAQTNLPEFLKIDSSFGSYEQRRDAAVRQRKADLASAEKKLLDLGLTSAEVDALRRCIP